MQLKRTIRNLLPFTLLLVAFPADAQLTPQGIEQPITYSGKVASLAVNTPALNFSVTTGVNTFILAAQPETAARIYIVNETSNACAAAFQVSVATTSQKNIGSFNLNQQNWATVPIINISGSYAANSGIIAIPALGSVVITSSAIAGQNVAVFVVNTNGSCASTSIDVLVEFATVSITSPLINVASGNNIVQPGIVANVQGIVSSGSSLAAVNPLAIGGRTPPGGSTSQFFSVASAADGLGSTYNTFPVGGNPVGPASTFNSFMAPASSSSGPLAVGLFTQQANVGGGVSVLTNADGTNGSANSNPTALNVMNTGFFRRGTSSVSTGITNVPLFVPPGTGTYHACYVTMEVTFNSGTTPTLDIYFQTATGPTAFYTDRLHFAQITNASGNFFGGISEGVGITPTVMTNNTLGGVAAAKVDGPIGSFGRFQMVGGGTAPSYSVNWGIACS